jgi:hypothetical protein
VWPVADEDEELLPRMLLVSDPLITECTCPLQVGEHYEAAAVTRESLKREPLRGERRLDLSQRVLRSPGSTFGRGTAT